MEKGNSGEVYYNEQLPFYQRKLGGIIVVNYLYRPILNALTQALGSGGILIYQTFMEGNAIYGRPRRPDFLLTPGELQKKYHHTFDQIGFFEGYVETPNEAMIQCYCGRKR